MSGGVGGFFGGIGSILSCPPHATSDDRIDGKHDGHNYFYTKSFLIASLLTFFSGFPFFIWGWSWWTSVNYHMNRRREVLSDLSCITGAILWMLGTAGIMAWSTQ